MNKDLENRIMAAVHGYIPDPIETYVEDKKSDKDEIFKLIMTLKHWANPLGGYSVLLPDEALKDDFAYLQLILKSPKKLLANEPSITSDDEEIILRLVRNKLNAIADKLADDYGLKDKLRAEVESQINADEWWSKKSQEEKRMIQNRYRQLSRSQVRESLPTDTPVIIYSNPSVYNYYLMCNHFSYLDFYLLDLSIRVTFNAGYTAVLAMNKTVDALGHAISNLKDINCCDCRGGGGNSDGKALLIVAAALALLAIITAGIIAGAYALKKLANSIINISQGKKVLRSLFRISGIGAGGYVGAIKGLVIGAALGSIIPGLGTAAGAIIGAIFCSGIAAGLGALTTKYTAKFISSIVYAKTKNPSNPEKYELTEDEKKELIRNNFDLTVINDLLLAIKKEKATIDISGSWPWSPEREAKNKLNELIKRVKKGEIPYRLDFAGTLYHLYSTKSENDTEFLSTHAQLEQTYSIGGPQGPAPSAPLASDIQPPNSNISYINSQNQKQPEIKENYTAYKSYKR